MKAVTHFFLPLMLVVSTNIYAQYNIVGCEKMPAPLQIVQIDYTGISTLVFIKYTNKESGWINIGDKTHLIDTKSNKVYYMLNSINIPLSDEGEPKVHVLDKGDQVHYFCLEFEKLPETVEKFNLIEDETNANAFNFYGITINKDRKTEFVNIDDFIKSTPVKEYGYSVKDGNLIFYYKHKGMALSMTLYVDNSYGDYYQAWINIQNFTGKNLLLNPSGFAAKSFMKKKEEIKDLKILSYEEYMKKVQRKQSWQNFAVAFSNGLAASGAGYSVPTKFQSMEKHIFSTGVGRINN